MKKKYIATLVAIMLLAGCGTPAPAAPSTTDEPDMEAIIQQSVDEAVQEKVKEYEKEQKKKDEVRSKIMQYTNPMNYPLANLIHTNVRV